jgi:curved DNA-binding protein CbpA
MILKLSRCRILRRCFSTKLDYNILYDPEKDYYKLLNVSDNCQEEELKNKFYSLSKQLHPDVGGNEEKYKIVTGAYEILKDKETKSYYDKLRSEYIKSLNQKADTASEEFRKKEYKKNNFRTRYHDKRKYQYKNNQEEQSNKQNYYKQDDKEYKHSNRDYNENFEENEYKYDKYYKKWKEYNNIFNFGNKAEEENLWYEFKINRNYKPTYRTYPDFIPSKESRLHKDNRMALFNSHPILLCKYGRYLTTQDLDPFKLKDSTFKLDTDYLTVLNKNDDSESLDSRITFRDMANLYSKKQLVLFMSALIFLYCLNLKL